MQICYCFSELLWINGLVLLSQNEVDGLLLLHWQMTIGSMQDCWCQKFRRH